MIRYVEKGYGLHQEIAAQGHSLGEVDGVWEADDEAAVQAIIDAYVEPLPDLVPSQFTFLLALSGLEDVWAGLEAATKGRDQITYATLRGLKARETFSFDETMRMIGMFAGLLPAGVDLGPDRVAALWREAMKF